MESLDLMLRAADGFPPHLLWWMNWMQALLIVAPLLLIRFRGARVLFMCQLLNFAVAYSVFVWEGHEVTRLFGVGHLFWAVALVFLIQDMRNNQLNRFYRGYVAVAVATICISLVFDVRDVVLWLMGERGPLLV